MQLFLKAIFARHTALAIEMRCLVAAAAASSALLHLTVEASKLTPPVLPLIVRNPYLSTWLDHAREAPWTEWPMFWTGERVGLTLQLPLTRLRRGHHRARSPSEVIC